MPSTPPHAAAAIPRRRAHQLVVYFNSLDRTLVGEAAFKAQLYQSMVGQALNVAMKITEKRVTNTFMTMIWQLGEVRRAQRAHARTSALLRPALARPTYPPFLRTGVSDGRVGIP